MSKQIDATIKCPKCSDQYPVKLYRTVWGEYPELREKVMTDQINICKCPHCGFSFHAPYAMMYTDYGNGIAIWWDPTSDPNIEHTNKSIAKMTGGNFDNVARIKDWEEFKDTINKYYSGEIPVPLPTRSEYQKGCYTKLFVYLAIIIIIIAALCYIL